MKTKLKPPDKLNPTFFGIHHSGFFKFFSVSNILQNVVCISLVTYEIAITVVALQVVQVDPLDEKIKLYCTSPLRAFAWAWFIVHCFVCFIMDIRLFRTAHQPSVPFLKMYSMLHWTSLPLFFILYYTLLLIGGNILPYPPTIANLLLPGHVLYRIYTAYIVFQYSHDIEWDLQMKSGFRNLTDQEIAGFENGVPFGDGKKLDPFYESCYEMALFKSYDKKRYEIPRDRLNFTDSTTLGCGEFGCVYKVQLLKGMEGGTSSVGVAVKTVDPELSDVHHFMALLTEAKVMSFMGTHENIVQLVGICTSEIRFRKLYIVCELCEFGNLRAHLRSERNTFVNLIPRNEGEENVSVSRDPNNQPALSSLSTLDLLKWSYEIACGMEFLSEQKIIHGDLAARNILLNSLKTAKITDFGLSRRLYNYSVYVKRSNVPLPWRWLAIESLVDMNFSTASDVWSYGVCCWEIFELGERPWPDFNTFTSEFIDAIKDGKRMEMPLNSNEEIFELLSACWRQDPSSRFTFSELKAGFRRISTKFCLNMEVAV